MSGTSPKQEYDLVDLTWDTAFFGVTCAKVILKEPLTVPRWKELKARCIGYQFVCLENRNSEPKNARLIGKETSAFLVDVNIQFAKKLTGEEPRLSEPVEFSRSPENLDQLMELTQFSVSRFVEDSELLKRGGARVHSEWLRNSVGKPDKLFAVSRGDGEVNGLLLHSYSGDSCTVELLAVSPKATRRGIGSALFRAVEYDAFCRGAKEIRVGTQVRNIPALNLYSKLGCKVVGCHQIYHMWNL